MIVDVPNERQGKAREGNGTQKNNRRGIPLSFKCSQYTVHIIMRELHYVFLLYIEKFSFHF